MAPRVKSSTPPTKTIHVAVVCNGPNVLNSRRGFGDWACFFGTTQHDAILKANHARSVWGPGYTILVGTLNGSVFVPYTIKPL